MPVQERFVRYARNPYNNHHKTFLCYPWVIMWYHEETSTGLTVLASGVGAEIAIASVVRARIYEGCPIYHRRRDGNLM
ncbi:hypothetical protein CY34DRAFT_752194 [Suillus luteus UH-Slu-Lm8-n1]|uniref:Uncharacterized protein n=1 Tax=Suillus luteus UH-Slu-Lm8-n1 TaxID=930992 RepID=A0A0D0ALJ3_9AGAM|nr:hypothetical protein CY34DRAFT_752194 [Suillus luteus UH-Slu-Lm8-n1]